MRLLILFLSLLWLQAHGPALQRSQASAPPPTSAAAAPATAQAPLTATLPVDPAVTVGRLPNGLRYYVRTNKQPAGRAELRLVVNAGSILEDDDQRGLAHFVEHMAFNGTKNFPKQAIAAFMQSIGMRFGPSVNATTSFDETVYALQVPTDKPEILERALLVLEDWAQNVTFDPVEVDKERGVVIEEWRGRRGAAARLQDAQFPVLLKGSRYADRIPIGRPEILQTFDIARLKQFYSTWYRPDLMAIVAVGDFNQPAVEGLIRKRFSGLPARTASVPRPSYPVPEQPGTLYGVATDKEAPNTVVTVYGKKPARAQSTVGDYRAEIVERLVAGMVSTRLGEIAQQPKTPILGASASRGRILRTADAVVLTASLKEDAIEVGMRTVFTEAARITRFGFTEPELERQKTITLRGFERAVAERDNRPSAQLAAEYIRNFTRDEPFPGLPYEYDLTRRFLPEITLAEVSAVAKAWLPDANRVVLLNAPEKPGVVVPDAARFAATLKAVEGANLTAYVAREGSAPLLDKPPPSTGKIARVVNRERLGITEWELSNGARVVLKPTTFKEDEVVFTAVRAGGTSIATDTDFVPAQTAGQVVTSLGVGKFASADLRRILTGQVAFVRPIIGPYVSTLAGGGSRRDVETLFQLIYLYFTQPRRDPVIFAALTTQLRSALASQTATPDFAFSSTMISALSQDHPRSRPTTRETIDAMDLDKSLAFYRDRFSDASGFTFVFVGNIDLEVFKPLIELYVGGLPSTRKPETWRDVGVRAPAGIVEKRVAKGIEPRSRTGIVFTGPMPYDLEHSTSLRAAADILQNRLRDALREALSATYNVTVTAANSRRPSDDYAVTIAFQSDPARMDALSTRVFEEIARFKKTGPTPQELADEKAALLRDFETNSRQNAYLLAQLVLRYELGESPETLLQLPDSYRQLTAARIQETALWRSISTGM